MDHNSSKRFSTGVPVSATRNPADSSQASRLCFAPGFFMFCASSRMTHSKGYNDGTPDYGAMLHPV